MGMKLSDFKGLFHSSQPKVREIKNLYDDYYEIRLSLPIGISWKPGQHALFTIKGEKMKGGNMRPFSLASISSEGEILLGTRIGHNPSDFKRNLISLKAGDKLEMRGPFGPFYVKDETTPLLLFASGVGITPIRAIIKSLEGSQRSIELVYVARDFYLYEKELNSLKEKMPNFNIYTVPSSNLAQTQLQILARNYENQAYYYISGAPTVIKSIKTLLSEAGISKKRVIADSFNGY